MKKNRPANRIKINYCIYLVISIYVYAGITHCGGQVRIPPETIQHTFAVENTRQWVVSQIEMRLVHSPQKTFWIDPFEQSELDRLDYFSVAHQTPRVSISVQEASQACQIQGKRLCTHNEWRNACLGTHRLRYSYASKNLKSVCNTQSQEVAPTGSFQKCHSDTGLHDMIGNSMEWVADTRSGMAIAMGGSFHTGSRADCFTSFYFHPGIKSEQIGFRCCRDQNIPAVKKVEQRKSDSNTPGPDISDTEESNNNTNKQNDSGPVEPPAKDSRDESPDEKRTPQNKAQETPQ